MCPQPPETNYPAETDRTRALRSDASVDTESETQVSATPAELNDTLSQIRDQLHDLRRHTVELTREYMWLSPNNLAVDELGELATPDQALKAARDSLDAFAGALGLADDAAALAYEHTSRLRFTPTKGND